MIINHVTLSTEKLGSFRYFALTTKPYLEKMGHKVYITPEPLPHAHVSIFNKHVNRTDVDYIANCRHRGDKTIFHISDNHFVTKYRSHYEMMCNEAGMITCTVPELKLVIKKYTGKEAVVIPDPYYYDEVEPRFSPGEKLKLCWFGNSVNIDGLLAIWEGLKDYDVEVISNDHLNGKVPFQVTPWSHEAMKSGVEKCDVVIIPSIFDDKRKVKSPNRMLDSIRRGRFVVATYLPCYAEFKNLMWVGNVLEGLEWVKKQKNEHIISKVKEAQNYIREKYSPKTIAEQWNKIFQKGE